VEVKLGDPESVARALVLRQLDARARTRVELERYLTRKGVPEDPAKRVLDRFVELRLIDDQALACAYVVSRHAEQGLARRALAMKLRQRGIDDTTASAALSEVTSDSEIEAARRLVDRKLRSMRDLDPMVQTRRLVNLLGRKGYPGGLAYQVVREAVTADSEGAGDGADGVPLDLD
jgi:regulatory protein